MKNLQSAARACTRRARLSASHDPHDAQNSSYTDDSAIGIDDVDADYNDSPDTDYGYDQPHPQHQMQMMGAQMGAQMGSQHHQQQQHQMMREQHHMDHRGQYIGGGQGMQGRGGHGHSGSMNSNGGRDMGIGSIINRGPVGV